MGSSKIEHVDSHSTTAVCVVVVVLSSVIMAAALRKRGGREERVKENEFDSRAEEQKTQLSFDPNRSISLKEAAFVFLCILGLVAIACLPHFYLPRPKTEKASKDWEFTAEKARKYLNGITEIGVRTVGSYKNDVMTVNYLLKEVYSIVSHAHVHYHIHANVQTASGGFMLHFLHKDFTVAYENITNIIVHLYPKNTKDLGKNVLLNCHFDTQPKTQGASDDAVSCAIMLETMRAISRSPPMAIKQGIVFLFNGAEEGVLDGSHAFVTQHKLAQSIKAFINLEAAGSGGREIVFQTGPGHPWLIHEYASHAKYPFASIMGQEIFQSGLIPSDTDFRIFRDYGGLVGIDIAYASNGYVYHTKHDTPAIIPDGSIQRAGDNVLAVAKALSRSPYLFHDHEFKEGKTVFFDFLGVSMVLLPQSLLNFCAIGCVSISYVYIVITLLKGRNNSNSGPARPNTLSFLISLVTLIFSWTSAIFVAVIESLVVTQFGKCLSWYSHPWFLIFLYGSPALAVLWLVHITIRDIAHKFGISFCPRRLENEVYEHSCVLAHIFVISTLVAFMTYSGILSTFLVAPYLLFPLIFHCIVRYLLFSNDKEFFSSKLILIHIFSVSFPIILLAYHIFSLFDVFVPIMGRQGTEVPPDVVFAIISSFSVIIITLYLTSLSYLVEKASLVIKFLCIVSIAAFALAVSGIMFPYSGNHPVSPKRIFLQHVARNFHNKDGMVYKNDSGIWFAPLDYLGLKPLMHLPSLKGVAKAECDGPYCGYPYFFPIKKLVKKTWYLKGPPPFNAKRKMATFRVVKEEALENGKVRFNVRVKGPDHMTLLVTPNTGNKLVRWSISEETPIGQEDFDGRITHYTYFAHGYYAAPWDFWLEFEVNSDNDGNGIADVTIAGHFLHGPLSTTKWMQKIVSEFPAWVTDTAFVSSYDVYRI